MTESDYRECEYFLIRIAPDPIRNEYLNIGVGLIDRESSFADIRMIRDFRRVECLFPAFDENDLRGLEDDLRRVIRREGEYGDTREQLLKDAVETHSLALQITDTKGVLTQDPVTEIHRLFEQYAQNPEPRGRSDAARDDTRLGMRRHLMTVFDQERVMGVLTRNKAVRELTRDGEHKDPFRFDFAYSPERAASSGRQTGLIHVVRVGRGETATAKELGFTVERLKAARNSFQVTAVVNDPSELDSADDREFEEDLLTSVGIELQPLSRGVELAARIRRECGLA